ncbi:uncharacterized protein LOC117788942 [Drosophila innubila]|uniref:uncharacterized protein LOC117788942 n=1 Tax=Drosophila innubila TaxID=198719 RepID=UPI00148E7ED6|nr:uncharacterized protein LOC117788942 [Drosophila innubila]
MEGNCSESSDSSSGSCNSIIWIGKKLNAFGSPELTKTTKRTLTSGAIKTGEVSKTAETSQNCKKDGVSEKKCETTDISETSDMSDIISISERTEIPETSLSIGRFLCSESTTSSEYDSDDSDISDETKIKKVSLDSSSTMRVDPEDMWKTFTDYEYASGTIKVEVPKKSIFEFLEFKEKPICLFNVPEKVPLTDIVDDMLTNNKGAYMCIEIGSRIFHCIPSLLKVYSPWFANQKWDVNNFKFDERDVPPNAFKVIYNWMRKKTAIKLRKAVKVMQAAKYLKIDLVVEECWKLFSKPNVREKIAFELFWEASNLSELDQLRYVMLSRIRFYFLPMVGTESFLKLTLVQLNSLLKLDSIGVNSEVEVFFAAIRWISYNSTERLPHIKAIMECIRFPYMSMSTLFAIREETAYHESQGINCAEYVLLQLRKDADIKIMLYNAMSYISLFMQNESEDDTEERIQRFIHPRRWIFNPKSPYHLPRLIYPYKHSITYSDFMNFIQSIQLDWVGEKPTENIVRNVDFDNLLKKETDTEDLGFLGDEE